MNTFIVDHDPSWESLFTQEKAALQASLGASGVSIHHIGSTSIPNILAKPIIDILIEATSLDEIDNNSDAMQALGYEIMGEFGIKDRRYFRKSNAQGIRTHHIHIFASGSDHLDRHLAFRDYLRSHPSIAQAYSRLKASLTEIPKTTMTQYIAGKDPFIKETESLALVWYRTQQ